MLQKIAPEKAKAALEYLTGHLQSGSNEPEMRVAAAKALGIAGGEDALNGLMNFLRVNNKAPSEVKAAALLAIGQALSTATAST